MANQRGAVLQTAIDECERFLQKAKAYIPEAQYGGDCPGRAAAKRASMDASKALSALRKSDSYDWDAR
jgi:hypothetical protein